MPSTQISRRDVYRNLAQQEYSTWPAYPSTPLYDRSSLGGLTEDIKTVASIWFDHEAHDSVETFVVHYPLKYINFDPHDRYSVSTQYPMAQLFRVFLLKALHGWSHETALVEYFQQHPSLREQLGFETLPDQSTLWRTWNQRFTTELQETIQKAARTILVKAEMAGVDVPRSPPRKIDCLNENDEDTALDDQEVLSKADEVTRKFSESPTPRSR